MLETVGDIWDYHDAGLWITITTNGTVHYEPHWQRAINVMGKGVALQAKERYPDLPFTLAQLILTDGNIVYKLPHSIYSFPVKTDWWKQADMRLIVRSCKQLARMVPENGFVYMVRPGCGAGGLNWRRVKPIIEPLLDDRFVVVRIARRTPRDTKSWG